MIQMSAEQNVRVLELGIGSLNHPHNIPCELFGDDVVCVVHIDRDLYVGCGKSGERLAFIGSGLQIRELCGGAAEEELKEGFITRELRRRDAVYALHAREVRLDGGAPSTTRSLHRWRL